MTKMEKFMSELEKLKTPDNEKVVGKLMEGVNLIADEYRRRKASENAAKLEAEGFAKLDKHRVASGLSTKAFVEGVGKTIMESKQPEEVKNKMMNSLSRYARHLTEATGVMGCIYSMEPVDEIGKEYIASNKIGDLLQKCVLPKSEHKYGDAATARKAGVDQIIQNNGTDIGGTMYKIGRKLIDSDHEKLILLTPVDDSVFKMPYVLHYADTPKAAMASSNMDSKSFTECIGNAIINSDYTEKAKSAMLEGFGEWIKGKAKSAGKALDKKMLSTTYYDSPEEQEALLDYILKDIQVGPRSKSYDNRPRFAAKKTGKDKIEGTIYDLNHPNDSDKHAKFTIWITNPPNGEPLLIMHTQMPNGKVDKICWPLKKGASNWDYKYRVSMRIYKLEKILDSIIMERITAENNQKDEQGN